MKNGPALTGQSAKAFRDSIAGTIIDLPDQFRLSLIWDQKAERSQHARLKIDAGLEIYFCTEIARSTEPSGTVAKRYGVSAETVRKWRKRGTADCLDHSARPHQLPWKASEEERVIVCAVRQATNFPLDELAFVVSHFLQHLNRDSTSRILKAEGLNRRPKPFSKRPAKGRGTNRYCDLGFIHIDIKHLPKLQTADGERRKRYLFVAIDRCSRSVHLAVKDDETEKASSPSCVGPQLPFPFA